MAIIGIGTDIVEIARFTPERLSGRFLSKVFTASEREYCLSRQKAAQHLAARFAAKEAAVKALSPISSVVSVFQVEVARLPSGAPTLNLLPGRHGEPRPELPRGTRLHVSLSHADDYATAVVIVESAD